MRISLPKTLIQDIINESETPVESVIGLYKHAIPNWDNVESVNHFPQVNKETSLFIINTMSKGLNGNDKSRLMMSWANNGFGCIKKDVPEWVVDIKEDKIIYKKKIKIKFEGIDSWDRPIFKDIDSEERYGSTGILCNTKKEVEAITVFDLCYFGNSFGCEPMGTPANNIEIIYKEN